MSQRTSAPEMVLQLGHREAIVDLAYSGDGRMLASVSEGDDNVCEVKLWDAHSGDLLRTLEDSTKRVACLAFGPNPATLATGGWDGKVRLWDATTGVQIRSFAQHRAPVTGITFSSNGRWLSTIGTADGTSTVPRRVEDSEYSGDCEIDIYDAHTYKLKYAIREAPPSHDLTFAPDGNTVAWITEGVSKVFDLNTGRVTKTYLIKGDYLTSLAFSPNGKWLAASGVVQPSQQGAITLWNRASGTIVHRIPIKNSRLTQLFFAPDSNSLLSGAEGGDVTNPFCWWHVPSGRLMRIHSLPLDRGVRITMAPGGRTIACGDDNGVVRILDFKTGQTLRQSVGHVDSIHALAFAPNGRTLATGNADGTVRLWDLRTGRLAHTIDEHFGEVVALDWSSDGSRLFSAGNDEFLKVWDRVGKSPRLVRQWQVSNTEVMAVSPNGALLVTAVGRIAGDNSIRVWDAHTGKLRRLIAGHKDAVTDIAFAPDNRSVATCSADDSVKLWDVEQGVGRATLPHSSTVQSVRFSHDGRRVVSADRSGSIYIWDSNSARLLRVIKDCTRGVATLGDAGDGRVLSAGLDGRLRWWDVESGKVVRARGVAALPQGSIDAWRQACSKDGKRWAAVDHDGSISIWNTEAGRRLANFLVLPPGTPAAISTEWVASTPHGFYTGSANAERWLHWRIGARRMAPERAKATYRRPDLVAEAFR